MLTRRLFIRLSMISLLAILSACGFKLRGAIELSSDVAPVYIEPGSLHEQARVIRAILQQNDIAALSADDKNHDQYQSKIHLLSKARQRRVLSVDGNGRVSEYLLIYKLTYALSIKYKPEQTYTLQVQRSLVYDPNAVLAVENQAEQLYQDMQKNAARLVLLKLQAFSMNKNMRKSKDQPPAPLEGDRTHTDPANQASTDQPASSVSEPAEVGKSSQ